MAETYYIPFVYPGNDSKFRITSTLEEFSLNEHNFEIYIKNTYGQVVAIIKKDECFKDSEGQWYFDMENLRRGVYHAIFIGSIPDDDYNKQSRIFTDFQEFLIVSNKCCSKSFHSCPCEHKIHYEQIWTINLDDGTYLCDKDGNLMLTADGRRIQFN